MKHVMSGVIIGAILGTCFALLGSAPGSVQAYVAMGTIVLACVVASSTYILVSTIQERFR